MASYGEAGWIDLSTGINRVPYPIGPLAPRLWQDLPRAADLARLKEAAAASYGVAPAQILPLAGAQAAIQLYPRLASPAKACVLGPTYNEHTASLLAQGWQVEEVSDLGALEGADLAVVVNPNNPDGRHWPAQTLRALAGNVGRLIVDESFADPVPEISVARDAGQGGLIVLRSFGKFYGLAGLRLGFVLGAADEIARLAGFAGPWSVSGPACYIGARALVDRAWQNATTARLEADAARLDQAALAAGWVLKGGTHLFRTYATPDATAAQAHLAHARIWSRIFPFSSEWMRLGLPGSDAEWQRLEEALSALAPPPHRV
jgi:cobalamin biosynthetic protein CobC